jgi:hypothetical protein
MPPKKDPAWAHFTKFEGVYKETPTSETKTRTKALCAFGSKPFVCRNVEQLNNLLAAPLGKAQQGQWLQVREERCARRAGHACSGSRLTGGRESHEEEDEGVQVPIAVRAE